MISPFIREPVTLLRLWAPSLCHPYAHIPIAFRRSYPGVPGYVMVSIAYGECQEPKNLGCDQTPDKCGFQPNHTIHVRRTRKEYWLG